jgi:hypothetical protein
MQPPLNTTPCKLRGDSPDTGTRPKWRGPGSAATPSGAASYLYQDAHPPGRAIVVFAIRPRGSPSTVAMPRYPLQETCLAVIYGTPLLASVFVALRIYTRRKLNLRLGWGMCSGYALTIRVLTGYPDDWLIILPTLLSLALIGPSYKRQLQSLPLSLPSLMAL